MHIFSANSYILNQIDQSFKERYQKCGDVYKVTACIGGQKLTNSWELDKETTSKETGVTMISSKIGVGRYKTIQKKGSNILEWTVCFHDCGFTSVNSFGIIRNLVILHEIYRIPTKNLRIYAPNLIFFRMLYAKRVERRPNFGWNDTVKCPEVTNLCLTLGSKKLWPLWVIIFYENKNCGAKTERIISLCTANKTTN